MKLWKRGRYNNHWVPVVDRCTVCDRQQFEWDYVGELIKTTSMSVFIPLVRLTGWSRITGDDIRCRLCAVTTSKSIMTNSQLL